MLTRLTLSIRRELTGALATAWRSISWQPTSWLLATVVVCASACQDVAGAAQFPPGTANPETYQSPSGAEALYTGTRAAFFIALRNLIVPSGLLTDELWAKNRGVGPQSIGAGSDPFDERLLSEGPDLAKGEFLYLHAVRSNAVQAIGTLATYDSAASPALRGELYALAGYAELLLAEHYCSGIPLSTIQFEGDFTYKPGSTSAEVYRHALALFDTALALSADSINVMHLARVGQGRAWLNLGQYDSAAAAVAAVPSAFVYAIGGAQWLNDSLSNVADREGGTGLAYASSGDPRTAVDPVGTGPFGVPLYHARKYPAHGTTPLVTASGVEARLIEAEAQLQPPASPSGSWLATLNALRTDGTVTVSGTDTTWNAGTGGVAGLAPLADPGSDTARVSLLFQERAKWLFLTAHRQGDLRRLVRQYHRPQTTVYPSGVYSGGVGRYGDAVTFPIPSSERANPYFTGCLDRDA